MLQFLNKQEIVLLKKKKHSKKRKGWDSNGFSRVLVSYFIYENWDFFPNNPTEGKFRMNSTFIILFKTPVSQYCFKAFSILIMYYLCHWVQKDLGGNWRHLHVFTYVHTKCLFQGVTKKKHSLALLVMALLILRCVAVNDNVHVCIMKIISLSTYTWWLWEFLVGHN